MAYPAQFARRVTPVLCPGRGRLFGIPLGHRPSLPHLRVLSADLFGAIIGTMPMSDFLAAFTSGLRPQGFPDRPGTFAIGGCGDLPVLVHGASARARGLRLRGVAVQLAISSHDVLPSASVNNLGTPDSLISELNTRPAPSPVNAWPAPLPTPAHDSGP